jgi:hypothetical protein
MRQNTFNLQVLFSALLILLAVELLAVVIISQTGLHPLLVIGLARTAQAASFLIIIRMWGGGLAAIGLAEPGIAIGLKKGLIWSLGFGLCAVVFLAILYFFNIDLQNIGTGPAPGSIEGLVLLFVVGGLISPVAEEIFFRGIVYGFLRRWSSVLAILGSTVAFSLAHGVTSGVSFIQVVGGLVFAVAYEVEKNLLVPITIHVLGNIAIFILSFLLVS